MCSFYDYGVFYQQVMCLLCFILVLLLYFDMNKEREYFSLSR